MNSKERATHRQEGPTRSGQYLESAIYTASPAQLRLMLIGRAVDVCSQLSQAWRSGASSGANEHSITLLDLLNELLSGVVGSEHQCEKDVCAKVADLYVFLTQHLVRAQEVSDADAVDEIKAVLEIECETWRAVCARSAGDAKTADGSSDPAGLGGLNLEA